MSPRGEPELLSGRSYRLRTIDEIIGSSPKKIEVGQIQLTEESDEQIKENKKVMLSMIKGKKQQLEASEAKMFGMLPRDFRTSSMNPILLAKIKSQNGDGGAEL